MCGLWSRFYSSFFVKMLCRGNIFATYLFNKSMSTGTLPQDGVCANVVPVFKRNDRHVPSNYQPVNLTSIVVNVDRSLY